MQLLIKVSNFYFILGRNNVNTEETFKQCLHCSHFSSFLCEILGEQKLMEVALVDFGEKEENILTYFFQNPACIKLTTLFLPSDSSFTLSVDFIMSCNNV